MRWLYHVIRGDEPIADPHAPPSLSREGFVHASYRPFVLESARLYFPAGVPLKVLQIDPRRLDSRVEEAQTPRGPMPHVLGAIPAAAVTAVLGLDEVGAAPDWLD